MKGIITEEDWDSWKNDITVDYVKDNHFTELRDAEVFQNRLESLDRVSNYVGEYFSKEWVQKNVLHLSDEDIESMNKEMEGESDGEEEQEAPDNSPTAGQKFELKPVQGDEKEDE
tara:strand:- start:96 stop:440 length:345 start_codon:yes stop_codon:yes gene_type:complete